MLSLFSYPQSISINTYKESPQIYIYILNSDIIQLLEILYIFSYSKLTTCDKDYKSIIHQSLASFPSFNYIFF